MYLDYCQASMGMVLKSRIIPGCALCYMRTGGKDEGSSDDRPDTASMINQTRPHAIGCIHPSRAIPTSVEVERPFCVKKNKMDG